MDFKLTEQQEMVRETARAFFAREFPSSRVREVESKGLAEFLPVYRKMGELGFLGIAFPEEQGGSGGGWLELALFNEEAGRALVPTVHVSSATLVGHALAMMATPARQRDLLPGLLAGETVVVPAYLEEGGGCETLATVDGHRFILRGRKRFVENFEVASAFLVTARDDGGRLGLFLVARESPGLRDRQWTLQSLDRVADLELDGVAVAGDAAFSIQRDQWCHVLEGGKIALAAYAVGAAQAAVDMAAAYSKTRIQFDRPIGSFQSLQHRLADAAMEVEQSRVLVQYAAWLREERQPCSKEAAMAKLLAGNALRRAAYAATLTHGGYGFMEEQDIQLYFRRAKLIEHQMGSPAEQREIILPAAG